MSTNKVVKQVYRALLKFGKRFDDFPESKALMYRRTLTHHKSALSVYYTEILDRLFQRQANFFKPQTLEFLSMVNIIRMEFRSKNQYSLDDRIDASFIFYRNFSRLWAYFWSIQSENSQLDNSSSAEPINDNLKSAELLDDISLTDTVCPGILLVAHPLIEGPLRRSVILILDHTARGSYGVIINRRTSHILSKVVKGLPAEILNVFANVPVCLGGMVRRLQYLHTQPKVGGLPLPLCGNYSQLYAGGSIDTAVSLIGKNHQLKDEFLFFAGCCTWDAGQLEQEISTGYWTLVLSNPSKILHSLGYMRTYPKAMNLAQSFHASTIDINSQPIVDYVPEDQGIMQDLVDTKTNFPIIEKDGSLDNQQMKKNKRQISRPKSDKKYPSSSHNVYIDPVEHAKLSYDEVLKETRDDYESILTEQRLNDEKSVNKQAKMDQSLVVQSSHLIKSPSNHAVIDDLWQSILTALGGHYSAMTKLPKWLQLSDVQAIDWDSK
jgi:putative AlgH/UPF0301 family transcriptional regulator